MPLPDPPKLGEVGTWASNQGQRALADLRTGVRAWARDDLAIDPSAGRLQRLAHAAFTPLILLRRVWRAPDLRREYLRITLPVALLTLAVGCFSAWRVFERRGQEHTPKHHAEQVKVVTNLKEAAEIISRELQKESQKEHVPQAAPREGLVQGAVTLDPDDEDDDADDDAAGEQAPAAPKPPEQRIAGPIIPKIATPPSPASPSKSSEPKDADDSTADDRDEEPSEDAHTAAWWSAIYGAMVIAEWCLLALTRHHQDQLARKIALASSIPPDDPEEKARLDIDIPWLFRKLKRRATGALMFTCCLLPATIISPFLGTWESRVLYTVIGGVWAVYWAGVFALGRSKLAWTHQLIGDPWFMRPEELLGRYKVAAQWFGPRIYVRILARVTRSVRPASQAFELAYAEAFGLGLARVICGFPVLYSLTRPVFAVAASHVLLPHLTRTAQDDPPTAAP